MTLAMRGSTALEEPAALWPSKAVGPEIRVVATNPRQAPKRRVKSHRGGQGADI
jgi:hypothetical protein